MRSVAVVGVSHHTAPVELRESLALDLEGRARVTLRALELDRVTEVVIVSTCNRTELFVSGEPGDTEALPVARLEEALLSAGATNDRRNGTDASGAVRRIEGEAAVAHALRVSAGLDSMVLGETQILGQVRTAYDEAVERRAVGPVFRRLFPASFRVAKRGHSDTGISSGAASVGSMAVELATKVFDDLGRRTALLLGAGDTGETIARALTDRKVGRLWIAGRGPERAKELAGSLGAHALTLEDAWTRLGEADIVLTAARSGDGDWVVPCARVAKAISGRRPRPRLFVDVGVPRNVEPGVGDLADVFLYDLDDLESLTESTRRRRRRAAGKVERFVAAELDVFRAWWSAAADLDPLLRLLHGRFDEIRDRELSRTLRRLPEEARPHVETFSKSLVDKLLQTPTRRLKDGGDRLGEMARMVRELFALEEDDARRGDGP